MKVLKKILIVEDDQLLNRTLAYNLTSDGYEVISVFNFDSAVRKLRENEFDVALLDINLPDGSGLDLCEEIRNRGQHTYIIFITANDKESDMLKGYEVGGADYVTKPFQPLEVVARVKGMLRRQSIYQSSNKVDVNKDRIDLGSIIIDRRNHSVVNSDQEEIKLTVIEFDILYLMASHRGHVFSADDIMQEVWQDSSVSSTKTVMVHVSNLRNKLEEATRGEKIIQTVWGVGYKINE